MKTQRGVALIQVLLMTGILGILVLQLGLTAREQVARARALEQRAQADLAAQSQEAALFYALLTEQQVPAARAGTAGGGGVAASERTPQPSDIAAAWNFTGTPFRIAGAEISMQDESGRMLVPQFDDRPFRRLLEVLGVAPDRALRLGQQLMERQSAPGGYPLQVVAELGALPDMDAALLARLQPLLTLAPVPGFNPLNAPPELLAAMLSDSQLAGVLELRAAGQLDAQSLFKATGLEADDQTVLAPGPAFRVVVGIDNGEVAVRRSGTVLIRPYVKDAMVVWSRE